MRGIIKNYKEAKVENKELRNLLSKGRGAKNAATAKKNEKRVPIVNSADYYQVTGTFSITPSGIFFPCK